MEYSEYLNLKLPSSSNNADLADISVISENFRKLDAEAEKSKKQIEQLNKGGLLIKEDFIEEQVNNWLDEHPEATTTVKDKSLTIDKMVIGTLGYITPQMFGAVGDGISDDTQALNDAFVYSAEHNVKCFIPKGTYVITPLKNYGDDITFFFDIKSDLNIEGSGRDETILKVETKNDYTAVFSTYDSIISNVSIKNLTIEQNPNAENPVVNGKNQNRRAVIHATSTCDNFIFNNIHFKNCCGTHVIILGNQKSKNVVVSCCLFDYVSVKLNWYDRSAIYMNCNNYLVENNTVHGNYDVLGGIELHGYNGTARNNLLKNCYTGIHISLDYASTKNTAGIFVSENRFENNARGIQIWGNYNDDDAEGVIGVNIINNKLFVDANEVNNRFDGFDGSNNANIKLCGIELHTSLKFIKDLKIIRNSMLFKGLLEHTTYNPNACFAISLCTLGDVDSVIISENYIEGCGGNGVKLGLSKEIVTNPDEYSQIFKNITVINNILKDCGQGIIATANQNYNAYINLNYGNFENVIIENNILEKTNNHGTAAFYSNSLEGFSKKNVYFSKNNIRVYPEGAGLSILKFGVADVIFDEGSTAQRPITAPNGHTFYDTTLKKMIVIIDGVWKNLDGTEIIA